MLPVDGMEHRNSTILRDRKGSQKVGMKYIGTFAHEIFFICWECRTYSATGFGNPFHFAEANMSGDFGFAGGFTVYYTNFILCRAGIITPQEYVRGAYGHFQICFGTHPSTVL